MTRVAGYLLVSAALLGALVAFAVAEPPRTGASVVEMVQGGVVYAVYRDSDGLDEREPDPVATPGERDALERFVAGLRERSGDNDVESLAVVGREPIFTFSLAQAFVVLTIIGLAGGAMLTFGARR